jgi:diacylglycerol diphosphate phosphatase/phosphatidate phosphatase
MSPFNKFRKSSADAPSGAQPTAGHVDKSDRGHHTMSRRPTFGQWLKRTMLDLITMVIMGAVGLGVYFAKPAPSRSFTVTFQDGEIVFPQFGFPFRDEIIPIWLAAFLASIIPILVFLLMQIRIRSFWDVNNATIGLLYSLITAAVFQVFLKWLIGGLRPHFLAVCKPDVSLASHVGNNGAGFQQIYFTRDICTGDEKEINDALESFPSGHTTAAFAGFVYLSLYLNAKLKVFANYHPAMWKLIAVYAPILGATLIGGALTVDEYHNWYDVVAGAIIGTIFAFSSYRMTYASIWDWRYNHIPLDRGSPFMYSEGAGELVNAVFTRKAGFGSHSVTGHGHGVHGHGHANTHGMHGHQDPNSAIHRRPVGNETVRGTEQMV